MSRNRFVDPESKRLSISDGDFVDVKLRLNHGEREDFFATIAPFDTSGNAKLDRHVLRTARLVTWVVGWSLAKDGKPVPMSADMSVDQRTATIRRLDTETFDEIHKAIIEHEAAVDEERAAEKNAQSATPASETTLPSVA